MHTPETPEQKAERRKDGITIKLPGGTEIKLGGYNVFVTVILVIVATSALLLYDHREASAKTLDKIIQTQEEQKEAFNEMIYVLSLSPEKRTELNLAMPKSLRERQRRRERDDTR